MVKSEKKGRPVKKAVVENKPVRKIYDFPDNLWLLIVFLLAFILYANSIPNKFVLDDYGVLKDNWVVKSGAEAIPLILKTPYRYGVNMMNGDVYRPLSLIMFAIEWKIAPDQPAIHHSVNVLLFALSSCLLLILLRRLFIKGNPLLPLIATLIWVAHPVHTEVVANIKSRDEILQVFFIFITLICFVDYLNKKRIIFLFFAGISYFLALMSKEGVITILPLFPLVAWFFTSADIRKNITASAVMLIPAVVFLIIRNAVLARYNVPSVIAVVDNLLVAAPDTMTRIAMAVLILGKYLFLLVFPYPLVSDYSYNQIPITGWENPLAIISLFIYGGALAYAAFNIRKKTAAVFGILFYMVTMSIYSNLFMLIGSSLGERFLYLPSVGFAIFITWVIFRLMKIKDEARADYRIAPVFKRYKSLWMLIAVLMILYSIATVARNREWKDQWSLFSTDITRSPNSAHLRYYWGLALRDSAKLQTDPDRYRSMMQQSLNEFNKGVEIYPNYPECYHQLGLANFRLGNTDIALRCYEKSISLNPLEAVPYANMGIIYFQKGDYQKARELYLRSVRLDPKYADGHANLGSTYGMLEKYDSAVFHFLKAIEIDPQHVSANYYLGITYQNVNKPELAKQYLEKAYTLNPSLKPAK